ncbi:hypothetical protein NQ317_007093 [Molorchus minor]|uniref:Equilibrative nucleoside transporter 3 n=1 Tax=Molorchus minor TaxID=1323400 RepID=A0ABQ9K3W7_9CUCU|nr:hypothetical protein NQ317_007093 [Molorchus minor]
MQTHIGIKIVTIISPRMLLLADFPWRGVSPKAIFQIPHCQSEIGAPISHRVKMEGYNEISDVFNRVSIASIEKSEKFHQELPKKPAPKDAFYLVRFLCLLFGLLHIMPLTFFVTANNYWMYKLRDVSSETVDLNNKTTLQTYFNSGLMITQSTSNILCMLLSSAFAHTIEVRSRVLSSLSIIAILFVLFTALIKVNTDSWQTAFFVLSLLTLSVICGVLTLFQVSTLALIPKFPPSYMKMFLMGQGGSGVFSGCLQIICLATGTSTQTSALFYFCSGTAVIFLALFMFFITKHLAFYQYYVEDKTVQMRKERLSKDEIKYVLKNIWSCIAICLIALVNLMLIHTSITGLVVSENYGVGNRWNDVFFVPTITYLYFDVVGLFGRYVGEKILITRSNAKWWVSLTVLRFVTVPLIMLCNAKPRSHLPVWFPHDWQYIIIHGVLAFTHGFLFNMVFLSIPRLIPGKEEAAFLLVLTSVGIAGGLMSPLSLLGVRIFCMKSHID